MTGSRNARNRTVNTTNPAPTPSADQKKETVVPPVGRPEKREEFDDRKIDSQRGKLGVQDGQPGQNFDQSDLLLGQEVRQQQDLVDISRSGSQVQDRIVIVMLLRCTMPKAVSVKGCGKPVYMRCGTPIPSSAIAEAITRATVSESVRRIVCFCASASRRIGKSW